MSEPDDHLIRLAGQVADGEPVDWDAASTGTAEDRDLVLELRVIASVLEAHRAPTSAGPGHPVETGAPGFPPRSVRWRWGALEVLEPIGQGGFSEVFRAFDPTLEREVALKLLAADRPLPAFSSERFLDEARRLARVRHPNVVTVHGADRREGRVGLWTDLVRGRTLEEILAEHGPLGAHEAAAVGMDLCRALAAVHAAGLVHGDVKTGNVMREQGGRIVLMDFGAVRDRRSDSPDDALSYGTLAAMAPEQLRGESLDPRSDVWSLGALLFRMLAGRDPVEAGTIAGVLERYEQGDVLRLRDVRPDLPADLLRVVERAMAMAPTERFPSVGAMEEALARSVGLPAAAPPARSQPSRAALAGMLAAGTGVLLVVAFWLNPPWRGPTRIPEVTTRPGAPRPSVALGDSAARTSADGTAPLATRTAPTARAVPAEPQARVAAPAITGITLYRETGAVRAELHRGDEVAPGDELSMDIWCAESTHVYVLNEDENGEVHVLFPIRGLDPSNPLAPGVTHHLPGSLDRKDMHWQITSPGGREVLIVLAARGPLRDLERDIASFPRASVGSPIAYGEMSARSLTNLRGIGGLTPAPSPRAAAAPRLAKFLPREGRYGTSGVWAWQTELRNPR